MFVKKRNSVRQNSSVTLFTAPYSFFKLYLNIVYFESLILVFIKHNKEAFIYRTVHKKFSFEIPL